MGRLMKAGWARDVIPALTGGIIAAGTTLAVRAFVQPTTPAAAKAYQWAPGIGAMVAAILGGGAMYFLAGKGPAASAATVGLIVGGAQLGAERLLAADMTAGAMAAGTQGLRAAVPQYGSRPGMGAIVWEQLRGNEQNAGETVALRGTVDTTAFGTPPFAGG